MSQPEAWKSYEARIVQELKEIDVTIETCLNEDGDKWENDKQLTLEKVQAQLQAILRRMGEDV